MSKAELERLQKDFPELANKLIAGVVDKFKSENFAARIPKPTGRYSDSTNATYYTKHYADKTVGVLEQFISNKDEDLLIPYKIIGLSRNSSKAFYTQSIHYILDNSVEFDNVIVDIAKHVKHKTIETGVRFSYQVNLAPLEMVRIPKDKAESYADIPASQLVLNWRSKIEEWLDTSTIGTSITVAPVNLTDDEVQDFVEVLASWGGLLHVVRNEKITVKKVGEPNA